jgi:hypothetical protein
MDGSWGGSVSVGSWETRGAAVGDTDGWLLGGIEGTPEGSLLGTIEGAPESALLFVVEDDEDGSELGSALGVT